VAVAAINGPAASVLSGSLSTLEAVAESLSRQGIVCHQLKTPYAFHHPDLAAVAGELQQALEGLRPQSPRLPIASTLTGRLYASGDFGSGYWAQQMREPVRFADAISCLADIGHEVFVELSPHPVLGGAIKQCMQAGKQNSAVVASLRRNRPDRGAMLSSLGRLYELGYTVAWDGLYPTGGRCIALPSYPWQHKSYWPESTFANDYMARKRPNSHPLLGEYLQAANSGTHCWQIELGPQHASLSERSPHSRVDGDAGSRICGNGSGGYRGSIRRGWVRARADRTHKNVAGVRRCAADDSINALE
jgi:myxalamid-type polyketide synthase MxaE and MxaD